MADQQPDAEDPGRQGHHLEPQLRNLPGERRLGEPYPEHPAPPLEDGMGQIEVIFASFGGDPEDPAVRIAPRFGGGQQPGREPAFEAVRHYLSVPDDEHVGQRSVAAHVVADQLLQRHQIVEQDLVGRLQDDLVREVLGVTDGGSVEGPAIAVGDEHGYRKAADHDHERDPKEQLGLEAREPSHTHPSAAGRLRRAACGQGRRAVRREQ